MNIVFLLKPKSSVAYVYDDNTLRQGLEKLRTHGYTAIPVISRSGEYVGTISDGDFLWFLVDKQISDLKSAEGYAVRDLLVRGRHKPVRITATMQDLLAGILDKNFVPVVDDRNVFVGIITRKEVLKYFAAAENRAHEEPPCPPQPVTGGIASRSDVIGLLDRICQWYRTNEPSSPVPILLERAKQMVSRDFIELLMELAPDGAPQFRNVAGLRSPGPIEEDED